MGAGVDQIAQDRERTAKWISGFVPHITMSVPNYGGQV
jgi:hypothetical protein